MKTKSGGFTEFIFAWNIFIFGVPIVPVQDYTSNSLQCGPDYMKNLNVHAL